MENQLNLKSFLQVLSYIIMSCYGSFILCILYHIIVQIRFSSDLLSYEINELIFVYSKYTVLLKVLL